MFDVGDSVIFTFDEHRRLRITVPEEYLPLAAWLYTDIQPNGAALDGAMEVLRRCQREDRTLLGNGCSVDFINDVVVLESLYERWPRTVLPASLVWSVLDGFRGFLAATASEPGLSRPEGYPDMVRVVSEVERPGVPNRSLMDHTYFPAGWSREDVMRAGEGAWQSAEHVRDQVTGVWSGMWQGLELAGYFDQQTGEALGYFPVISP